MGSEWITDNMDEWSGDHCIDYKLAPGVLFTNRKVAAERPGLIDLGPSILEMFGVKVPDFMMGKPVFATNGDEASATNASASGSKGADAADVASDKMRAGEDV